MFVKCVTKYLKRKINAKGILRKSIYNQEIINVIYVSNQGSDSYVGSQYQPYKTINYALSQATSGDIV